MLVTSYYSYWPENCMIALQRYFSVIGKLFSHARDLDLQGSKIDPAGEPGELCKGSIGAITG